jgi:rhodanese-related sulfurtransferase
MEPVRQMTPQVYSQRLGSGDAPLMIDVREPWEYALAHVDNAQLMPLGNIHEWSAELDKTAEYVVICHHGGRSAMACQFLMRLGIRNVWNLDGGIDAWSMDVDPQVPRY